MSLWLLSVLLFFSGFVLSTQRPKTVPSHCAVCYAMLFYAMPCNPILVLDPEKRLSFLFLCLLRLLTMWLLLRLRSGSVAVLLSLPSGADFGFCRLVCCLICCLAVL